MIKSSRDFDIVSSPIAAIPHGLKTLAKLVIRFIFILYITTHFAIATSDDSEFYLLELQTREFILDDGLPAYVFDNRLYVSFEGFLAASEFLIFRKNESLWTGWFFNQEHSFYLNRQTMEAKINHTARFSVGKNEIIDHDEGVLIQQATLEKWFDITLIPDFRQQTLSIETEHLFPVELRAKRENTHLHIDDRSTARPFMVKDRYQWITSPRAFIQGNINHIDNDGNMGDSESISFTSSLDLLKHSVFYTNSLANTESEGLTSSQRLTIEKRASTERGQLMFGAGQYEIGDIFLASNNLVMGGGSGSGVAVERNHNRNNISEATVTLEGDATIGWDTELYRNGQLLDFSSIASDGRYIFRDQPTLPGKNTFLIRIYGPQGQYEEQVHVVWGGGLELAANDYRYQIAAIDYTYEMLNGEKDNVSSLPAKNAVVFEFGYGLNDDLQLGLGFYNAQTSVIEETGAFSNEQYSVTNFRSNLLSGILLGEWAHQFEKGSAKEMQYIGHLNNHDFILSVHYFDEDFKSPSNIKGVNLESSNKFSLNGPVYGSILDSYSFRVDNEYTHDDSEKQDIYLRLNKHLGNIYLGNELNFTRVDQTGDTLRGEFKVSGRFDEYSLSGNVNYSLQSDQTFNSANATLRWRISDRLFSNLGFTRQFSQTQLTQLNYDLSWKNKGYDLAFNTSITSNDYFSVGLSISTSVGYEKSGEGFYMSSENLANRGRIAVNTFIDDNNNQRLDIEESIIENVRFNGIEPSPQDTQHRILLNNIPSRYPYQLLTRDFQIDNPDLTPTIEKYEIYTHPGSHIELNIPMIVTGDIEGSIVAIVDGKEMGVQGITIELLRPNNSLVKKTLSEFDGYYSFLFVAVGQYRVVIRDEQHQTMIADREILLEEGENYVEVEKIILN
jgi:hypothetical protein